MLGPESLAQRDSTHLNLGWLDFSVGFNYRPMVGEYELHPDANTRIHLAGGRIRPRPSMALSYGLDPFRFNARWRLGFSVGIEYFAHQTYKSMLIDRSFQSSSGQFTWSWGSGRSGSVSGLASELLMRIKHRFLPRFKWGAFMGYRFELLSDPTDHSDLNPQPPSAFDLDYGPVAPNSRLGHRMMLGGELLLLQNNVEFGIRLTTDMIPLPARKVDHPEAIVPRRYWHSQSSVLFRVNLDFKRTTRQERAQRKESRRTRKEEMERMLQEVEGL